MLVLVSPNTLEGAKQAILGGADIIDCKNPAEGSLGANFPWIISEMK
ncbi:MAG: (5-formylfuran-3-yl)methyl phosphate synthase, partial [Candidatus Hodarchaeota archaeon]